MSNLLENKHLNIPPGSAMYEECSSMEKADIAILIFPAICIYKIQEQEWIT